VTLRTSDAVDVVLEARALLGEAPVWDGKRGELVWVDVDRGLVHLSEPTGAGVAIEVGQPVGCALPRVAGGLMLAVRDGFASLERDDDAVELVLPVERHLPDNRMNDGACDVRGRLWAGTMSVTGAPRAGALYRLDPDLHVTRAIHGVTISNGIGWSPDNRTMYFIDTPLRRVDAFDFDVESGTLRGRRTLVRIPPDEGKPDGMSVDEACCLWVALWGGGAVQRYTPEGRLDRRIALPVSQVTSCCFGGLDGATLYITTAARGLGGREPLAGALFAARPGVAGPPMPRFAG
jgi:sugar lactone lactonase YvrE